MYLKKLLFLDVTNIYFEQKIKKYIHVCCVGVLKIMMLKKDRDHERK